MKTTEQVFLEVSARAHADAVWGRLQRMHGYKHPTHEFLSSPGAQSVLSQAADRATHYNTVKMGRWHRAYAERVKNMPKWEQDMEALKARMQRGADSMTGNDHLNQTHQRLLHHKKNAINYHGSGTGMAGTLAGGIGGALLGATVAARMTKNKKNEMRNRRRGAAIGGVLGGVTGHKVTQHFFNPRVVDYRKAVKPVVTKAATKIAGLLTSERAYAQLFKFRESVEEYAQQIRRGLRGFMVKAPQEYARSVNYADLMAGKHDHIPEMKQAREFLHQFKGKVSFPGHAYMGDLHKHAAAPGAAAVRKMATASDTTRAAFQDVGKRWMYKNAAMRAVVGGSLGAGAGHYLGSKVYKWRGGNIKSKDKKDQKRLRRYQTVGRTLGQMAGMGVGVYSAMKGISRKDLGI